MNITERLDELWDGEWKCLLDNFRVSGGLRMNTQVVFIGESPHTDEVQSGCTPECRYPLAGQSGKIVTEALRGILPSEHCERPIGQLAADGDIDWLSIINVSEMPLDVGVYHRLVARDIVTLNSAWKPSLEDWLKLMYSFQLIKNGAVKNCRQESFANDVESRIKDDFLCRARLVVGCNTKLVVFLGNTAKSYYEKMCPGFGIETRCVKHPSPKSQESNKWTTDRDFCLEIQDWCNSAIQQCG